MFRLNILGLIITAVSFGLGYVIGLIAGQGDDKTVMTVVAGILMLLIDITLRYRTQKTARFWGRWLAPQNGGWLEFPLWVMGFLFVIYGFVEV